LEEFESTSKKNDQPTTDREQDEVAGFHSPVILGFAGVTPK